jgi:hypothetical protein
VAEDWEVGHGRIAKLWRRSAAQQFRSGADPDWLGEVIAPRELRGAFPHLTEA